MAFLHSVEFLLGLQRFSSPFLDGLMQGISFLGGEVFYFVALIFLYWRVSRKLAFRLALVVLLSLYGNFLLKDIFQIPRPQGETLRVLETPEDFSFPSGHAQSVASFWFFLAFTLRKPFLYLLAGILVVLVSLSRLYLGVHYLQDVLVGASFGVLFALAFLGFFQFFSRRKFSPFAAFAFLVSFSFFLFFFAPSPLGVKVAGSLSGVLFGYWLTGSVGLGERSFSGIEYAWGIGCLILLYVGGKALPFGGSFWLFVRYFLLNFFATFGFPFFAQVFAGKKE